MLRELALPKGSEAIVSALAIPGMWTLLEHHGPRIVPVDVDPAALAPTALGGGASEVGGRAALMRVTCRIRGSTRP
jgi:hypothetical protein